MNILRARLIKNFPLEFYSINQYINLQQRCTRTGKTVGDSPQETTSVVAVVVKVDCSVKGRWFSPGSSCFLCIQYKTKRKVLSIQSIQHSRQALEEVKYFRYEKNSGNIVTNEFSTKMCSAETSILLKKTNKQKRQGAKSWTVDQFACSYCSVLSLSQKKLSTFTQHRIYIFPWCDPMILSHNFLCVFACVYRFFGFALFHMTLSKIT